MTQTRVTRDFGRLHNVPYPYVGLLSTRADGRLHDSTLSLPPVHPETGDRGCGQSLFRSKVRDNMGSNNNRLGGRLFGTVDENVTPSSEPPTERTGTKGLRRPGQERHGSLVGFLWSSLKDRETSSNENVSLYSLRSQNVPSKEKRKRFSCEDGLL